MGRGVKKVFSNYICMKNKQEYVSHMLHQVGLSISLCKAFSAKFDI